MNELETSWILSRLFKGTVFIRFMGGQWIPATIAQYNITANREYELSFKECK